MELRLRMLLNLLYAAVAMILLILTITLGYALGGAPEAAEESVACCGTPSPDPDSPVYLGKNTWNANACGSCHNKNMKDDMTGPALGGVTERWAAYPREDLYAWIRNSQALIASGHPRAVEVYEANDKATMSNYTNLTDEEIEGLLAYIKGSY